MSSIPSTSQTQLPPPWQPDVLYQLPSLDNFLMAEQDEEMTSPNPDHALNRVDDPGAAPSIRQYAVPNKSQGRLTKLPSGDIFFSPNCCRDFKEAEYHGFFDVDSSTTHIKPFLKPHWWAGVPYTYLAFLPLSLDTSMPPLDVLSREPIVHYNRSLQKYYLDAKIVLEWNTLEHQLLSVIREIGGYFRVFPQTPLFSSAISCTGNFDTRKDAMKQFERTRDWYAHWVGLLAFNISIAILATDDHKRVEDAMPSWWLYLHKNDLHPQQFLSALQTSDLGSFTCDNRVGVIVNLSEPLDSQPTVDFFFWFKIPIWYPWGLKEVAASVTCEDIRRWGPPVEELQKVATFFVVDPKDDRPWIKWFSTCDRVRKQCLKVETKEQKKRRMNRERQPPQTKVKVFIWRRVSGVVQRVAAGPDDSLRAFGENQRVYNSIANEWDCSTLFGELTPEEERQLRDSDLLIPEQQLRTGAPDLAGGYDDLAQEMAEEAAHFGHSADRGDVMMLDPPENDRLPSVRITNSLIVDCSEGDAILNQVPEDPLEEGEIVEHGPRPSAAAISVQKLNGEYDWAEFEALDLLTNVYGFRPPLKLPSNLTRVNTSRKMIIEIGAMNVNVSEFLSSPIADLVGSFWQRLSASGTGSPPEDLIDPDHWDLHPKNTLLYSSSRFSQFSNLPVRKIFRPIPEQRPVPPEQKQVKPKVRAHTSTSRVTKEKKKCPQKTPLAKPVETSEMMWVLDRGAERTVDWQLAVFSVVDMLMICRMPDGCSEMDILQELINRGFRCQMLMVHQGIPPSVPPPVVSVPIRSGVKYQFEDADWQQYKAQARVLLQNPRIARGAVLAGGILWRVALLFRTSLAFVTHGQETPMSRAFFYPSSNTGYRLDTLHPQEADVLCGLYHYYTSSPHPDKISWFPLVDTWAAHVSHPFWTPHHEKSFLGWLKEYNTIRTNQPLASTKWGHRIRASSATRRAFGVVEGMSKKLVGFGGTM